MRSLLLLMAMSSLLISSVALAKKKDAVKKMAPRSKLETEMKFNEMSLRGKYKNRDEALAEIEDDKLLDDLLGLRLDFKDRIKKDVVRK